MGARLKTFTWRLLRRFDEFVGAHRSGFMLAAASVMFMQAHATESAPDFRLRIWQIDQTIDLGNAYTLKNNSQQCTDPKVAFQDLFP